MFQDFCLYIFLFDHFFVKFAPDTNRFLMLFVIQGLDLIFSSFFVEFLIGTCLSRVLLKSWKKVSKPKSIIIIFCGKVPVYFLQIPFERVNVKISEVSVGSTYLFSL